MALSFFARGVGQDAAGIPAIAAAYASVSKAELGLATTTLVILISFSSKVHPTTEASSFFYPFITLVIIQLFFLAAVNRLPLRISQGKIQNGLLL